MDRLIEAIRPVRAHLDRFLPSQSSCTEFVEESWRTYNAMWSF